MHRLVLLLTLLSTPLFSLQVIAHRGASLEAPENTLSAFQRAVALEADFIEMDIRLTEDGVPVVFHDETVERTSNGYSSAALNALSFSDVKRLDVGAWFSPAFRKERVPTLAEVLAMERENTGLMLEFKQVDRTQELVEATARLFEKYPQEGKSTVFLASSSLELLQTLHERLPKLPLIAIVENEEQFTAALELPIRVLALHNELVTRERARTVHEKKLALWAFTVNAPGPANEMVKLGADGIISDNPRTIRNSIQR